MKMRKRLDGLRNQASPPHPWDSSQQCITAGQDFALIYPPCLMCRSACGWH